MQGKAITIKSQRIICNKRKTRYSKKRYFLINSPRVRLSYKIPIYTALSVMSTVLVNIFAFQFFTQELLPGYLKKIEIEETVSANSEQIQALTEIGKLDKNLQDEYEEVLIQLTNLQSSLKNISKNPELYTQTGVSNGEIFTIPLPSHKETSIENARWIIDNIANPRNINRDTPEWEFIIDLLGRIIVTNLLWITLLILIYALWIKRVFMPIEVIIRKLQDYIDTSLYTNIPYSRNDEFFPLISTINNLHKSLSLQEAIRSNFLSDLSHEIRTPITAVKCYLEAIEDGMMKIDEKTTPLLHNELSRLADITEKIMEYEHLAHDSLSEMRIERFDPTDTMQNIIQEYLPQSNKNIQTITIKDTSPLWVRMDQSMFIQILHNIFSNFIKYSWTNTELSCSITKNTGGTTFIFEDNGVWIPESELEHVKEKFYKVNKARTRDIYLSMGIGFSIIEKIARLHGGTLTLENNTPHGLIVRIFIPK